MVEYLKKSKPEAEKVAEVKDSDDNVTKQAHVVLAQKQFDSQTGEALAEDGSLCGKFVQMRRNRYWVACMAHCVCALLIAEDEYYVRSGHESLASIDALSHNAFATGKRLLFCARINNSRICGVRRARTAKVARRLILTCPCRSS